VSDCREFRVLGLDCPDCAATVEQAVARVDGVAAARLNFASGLLEVEPAAGAEPWEAVAAAVRAAGHGIESGRRAEPGAERAADAAERAYLRSTAAAALLLVAGWSLSLAGGSAKLPADVVFVIAALLAGWVTARRALVAVRTRRVDMNVLMVVAVVGAFGIGAFEEAASVTVLFAVGNLLESRALVRTRRSLGELIALAPPRTRVIRGTAEVVVRPDEVGLGELIVVAAGERIALDGRVVAGESDVDEAPVTGESTPVAKRPGDVVFAGTLAVDGALTVEATAAADDSTLARIVRLVEQAQGAQAPVQRLVDRFSAVYTPIVLVLAALVAVVPPVVGAATGLATGSWVEWLYRALVLLVIACPCALVISTPVAMVSAITRAARAGVLVKGGAFLEGAPRVRVVAFDKTGTLTLGRPRVVGVRPVADGIGEGEVLARAAALERGSAHPIAVAVVAAARAAGVHVPGVTAFANRPGRGVEGVIDGVAHLLASPRGAGEAGVVDSAAAAAVAAFEEAGATAVVLASDGRALGVIGVADEVRPEAAAALAELRRSGIERLVMLTGDNERVAAAIGAAVGVDEVRSGLLPEDKLAAVAGLADDPAQVAMVGDGVNDAPALAAAGIGIALGAAGSATAVESADVALMDDAIAGVPFFFRLGRAAVGNVRFNIGFSLLVKLVFVIAAVLGFATLWMAVFADVGVSLLVTLNGLRLLAARGPSARG
jgi:Cd2+/Zn2+-exporting ATPase